MTIEQAIELLNKESQRCEAEAKNLALKIVTDEDANTPQNNEFCQKLITKSECYSDAADKITD